MRYTSTSMTWKKGALLLVSMVVGLGLVNYSFEGRAGYTPIAPQAITFTQEAACDGDDGEVWVTSQGTDRLFVLQGQGSCIETVNLPPGAGPHIVTFSPSGQYAYASGMGNGGLFILRADDRQLIQTLSLGTS